jgi:hypothetical protein
MGHLPRFVSAVSAIFKVLCVFEGSCLGKSVGRHSEMGRTFEVLIYDGS